MVNILVVLIFFFSTNSFSQESQQALVQLVRVNEHTGSMIVEFPQGLILKDTSKFEFLDSLGNACESTLLDIDGNRALFSARECAFDKNVKPGNMLKLFSKRSIGAEKELVKIAEKKVVRMGAVERKKVKKLVVTKHEKKEQIKLAKKNNESWYLNLGGGSAFSSSLSSSLGSTYDSFDEIYSLNNKPILLDLGFYFPKKDGSILIGTSLMYSFFSTEGEDNIGKATFSQSSILLNFSLLNFFGATTGRGLFIRSDIGITQMATKSTEEFNGSTIEDTYSYSPGIGVHLELGYGFSFTEGTSALFSLAWTRSQATLNTVKSSDGTAESEVTFDEDVSHTTLAIMGHLFF